MKIFLHVGHGKCASSSIQSFFSNNHTIKGFAYGCLREDASIETGYSLKKKASIEPTGYQNSIDLKKINYNDKWSNKFLSNLKSLSDKFDVLFMSNETWNWELNHSLVQDMSKFYEVEVIYIIRPPVQWINSAWWQWGNWSNENVNSFVKKNMSKLWLDNYRKLESFIFIKNIHLLSLNSNILDDIFNILDIKIKADNKKVSNIASSRELLSFMNNNRELRDGIHNSSKEFILNKYLKPRNNANWVLSPLDIDSILTLNKKAALKLAPLVNNENILNNKYWWDASAYSNKIMNRSSNLTKDELNDLLLESYNIIIKLHNDNNITPRPTVDDINLIRDIAVDISKVSLKSACLLMGLAHKLRPNGFFINKKLQEYKQKLK